MRPARSPYRLGHHPRQTDLPALLNADGTVAHMFAYNATQEEIIASLEHASMVLHSDGTVDEDGDPPKEGGEIAASRASSFVLVDAPDTLALGRQLAAASLAYDAYDKTMLRQGNAKATDSGINARGVLDDRVESLRVLISTTPAKTLGDAAVLISECLTIAGRLEASVCTPAMVEEYSARLERMLLSAMPLVAEAAGLDMDLMDWADRDMLRVVRFQGVGVQE